MTLESVLPLLEMQGPQNIHHITSSWFFRLRVAGCTDVSAASENVIFSSKMQGGREICHDIMYIFFFQMPNEYGADLETCDAVFEYFKYSCTQLFAVSTLFKSGITVLYILCFTFWTEVKNQFFSLDIIICEMRTYGATLILSLLLSSGHYHVIW